MHTHRFKHRFPLTCRLLLAILLLTVVSPGHSNAALSADEQIILSGISVASIMQTLERLCDDDFAGRRSGSPEHYAVINYLTAKFAENGLAALDEPGIEGYTQPLTMRYALVRSKDEIKATLSYDMTGAHGSVRKTRSFAYRGFNGPGGLNLDSEVVFVGYGIHDPEAGYDDYAGLDVTGKIVLWLPGQPNGVKLARGVTGAHKMLTAYQRGAAACLIYRPSGIKDEWGTNVGLTGYIADFPYIAIDEIITSELLSPSGINVAALFSQDLHDLPVGVHGAKVQLRVTPVFDPERPTCNVVGVIPGADPEAAHEIVLIGAHFDHIGVTECGAVFRGADDNASGTSVIIEVARAIRQSGLSPRRTIVFAAWTAEEAGLIGSSYFAANPPFPLANIVSSVHLDMVGIGTYGTFMTTGAFFEEHYRHLETSAQDLGFELKADVIAGASDHLAFARKKAPSSLIHSAGDRPNLHTTRDTPDTIDWSILESAAQLAALAVWRAANG